jgi:hypothetical protein
MKLIILITLLAGSAFAGTVRIKNTPAIEDGSRAKSAEAVQATLGDILSNAQTNIEKSVFSNAAEKQEIGDIRAILIDLARENKRLARIVAKLQAEP